MPSRGVGLDCDTLYDTIWAWANFLPPALVRERPNPALMLGFTNLERIGSRIMSTWTTPDVRPYDPYRRWIGLPVIRDSRHSAPP